ncbi:PREDICTED: glutamate receptor 2-like [Branchiostoma belcheri]|uniref:Glutamate receptor 2-like n=1 Tax=Branchiostoma belcheri TaxID=7741 RepID=A0A6P4YJ66_BRABE|nr:PREDICTED: glutamate receptor 2-like [Branchiostoma belcheri]
MALAFVLLIGEFIYTCAQDVKKSKAHPKTFAEAATTRLKRVFSRSALSMSEFPAASSALKLAVEYVNENGLVPNVILEYIENTTTALAFLDMIQHECYQAKQGVVAIMGPILSSQVKASSPVSTGLSLPQIAPEATDPTLGNAQQYPQLIRISWPDSVLSKALIDLLEHFSWDQMSIFVSNDDYGVHGLVDFQLIAGENGWRIHTIQSFDPTENAADIVVQSQLGVIKDTGARIIVLHCLASYAAEILRVASTMDMTGAGWAWVVSDGITGLDLFDTTNGTANVPDYLQGLLGPIPPSTNGAHSQDFMTKWRAADPAVYPGAGVGDIGPYTARWADAVLALAQALRNLQEDGVTVTPQPLDCGCDGSDSQPWADGPTMLQYLKQVETDGVTGNIRFDSTSARLDAEYNIVNLKSDGWQKVGTWNLTARLDIHPDADIRFSGGATTVVPYMSDLSNRTLRVVTIAADGFVEISDVDRDGNNVTGNDRFQGFCMDLFSWMSTELGFKYEYYEVEDGQYGLYNAQTGKWSGLVGDVLDGKADIAVAIMSITAQRQADGDFTLPYYDNGITFAMKKTEARTSNTWGFISPFQGELWATILLTALAVGLFQGVANFATKDMDEENDEPAKEDDDKETGFWEAVWQSFVALVQLGPEFLPRSLSGRISAFFWGIGILVAISTYTANLAAFLTVRNVDNSISSAEDLLSQTEISYGAISTYSSWVSFRTTTTEPYHSLGVAMQAKAESVLVENLQEGVEKMRQEKYALFTDSAELDYMASRQPCDLQTIGRLFWQTGYGMFLPKNSKYTVEFNHAIVSAEERGVVDELDVKWIKSQECSGTDQTVLESSVIGLQDMLGVFVLVYGGMALALIVLICEFIHSCNRDAKKSDPHKPMTVTEAVKTRLKRIFSRRKNSSVKTQQVHPSHIHPNTAFIVDLEQD